MLAHVRQRDVLTSTITATIAGAISVLANFGRFFGDRNGESRNPALSLLAMIVAPIAAMLIQFAIARAREFDADRGGAVISGDPRRIVNPLTGGGVAGLFNTHPSTDARVARLRAIAAA